MTEADYKWLDEHKLFMYASQHITKEERQELYNIYNRITGEKKKPNGCGRCLRTTLNHLKQYYEKHDITKSL
tara:strand:- start:400 stop:615 length:216 start_codon:yes stop_codon:yes gene_type:complete